MIAMTYIEPLVLVFGLATLLGLFRLRRCKRSRIPIVAALGLLLLSWPPVDWLLSRPLEGGYPIRPYPSQPAQAIVVLSSAVSPPRYERPYALPDRNTYQRCDFAAWLYRSWRQVPLLACGGPGAKPSDQPVSATMRQLLQRAGVPDNRIWTEERSRSTHENAVFGAEILRQHGIQTIVLVVEAQSMLRAAACFRKEGLTVIPAPCEFREFSTPLEEYIPTWKAIGRNEATLHEVAGLAWYWLRRWI